MMGKPPALIRPKRALATLTLLHLEETKRTRALPLARPNLGCPSTRVAPCRDYERQPLRWQVGLAGASVGIGACLPQGPGTIEAAYPDDAKVGGANRIEVTISTPKMIRAVFAVDDTDTREKGATWVLMLKAAREAPVGHLLLHRIVQLNPNVKEKTTQCVAVGVSFAVIEKEFPELRQHFIDYIRKGTFSQNTVLAICKGLRIPDVVREYGAKAKVEVLSVDDAVRAAKKGGIELVEITGPRGAIGALAGIGCHDMGIEAAGLPEDFI